jgi:hypothetical protein
MIFLRIFSGLLCLLFLGQISQVHSATYRLGLLHGDVELFDYEISVVRLALANVPGEHELEVVPIENAPQNRIFAMLEGEHAPIDLFFSGYSLEREKRLRQINIPLTRGLLGLRLLVAKSERVEEFSDTRSLEDLQKLRIGSGIGWPENEVLIQNGLTLDTSLYRNLWRMLEFERFDVFQRGVNEVFTELGRPEHEQLSIVPGVALAMRYDYFLYVARERKELHDILLEGLENAYRNGSFIENFRSHPQISTALERAQLAKRRLIWLDSPVNSLTRIPAEYWYLPPAR